MPTMTDPIPSLDLRLTPDWLKESEPANRYANYEGEDSQDRQHRGRRERRDDRSRRPSPPTDRNRREQTDRRAAPSNRSPQATQQRPLDANRPLPPRTERPRFQRREDHAVRPEAESAPVQID